MFNWTRGGVEDRWHQPETPGAWEWWGFEAVDSDRGLVFCLRIAAGDPVDPYHARLLAREPESDAARAGRNILVRAVLYREGRRVWARTLRPGPDGFAASATSGAVEAGPARVTVEETASGRAYRVNLEPGTRLDFIGPPGRPAGTGPLAEPVWDLAPLDLRVSGMVATGSGRGFESLPFRGRGVHEHGAGPGGLLPGLRSWAWGWGHAREFAIAWRQVVTSDGRVEALLIVDREGEPLLGEEARSRPFRSRCSLLGVPYRRQWRLDVPSGAGLAVEKLRTLASSPIGMRFLSNLRFSIEAPRGRLRLVDGVGLTSVARPFRVHSAPVRWLMLARERWPGPGSATARR
jgi:carotenoid 1,2-hydratase